MGKSWYEVDRRWVRGPCSGVVKLPPLALNPSGNATALSTLSLRGQLLQILSHVFLSGQVIFPIQYPSERNAVVVRTTPLHYGFA